MPLVPIVLLVGFGFFAWFANKKFGTELRNARNEGRPIKIGPAILMMVVLGLFCIPAFLVIVLVVEYTMTMILH